ncbi:unnamed protein product [Lactuca virosa]|uniref:Pectate lyase n=1 Tax=Lactuca virosa TaxID=75947 RepID=A0AAU9LLE9_9ASTR|nr:unnamed protein product [Lactuca virosa]
MLCMMFVVLSLCSILGTFEKEVCKRGGKENQTKTKHYFVLCITQALFLVPVILARTSTFATTPNNEELEENTAKIPEKILTAKIANQTEGSLPGSNSTRRDLHTCQAANPIDKCGGGKGGEIYEVTDPSDDACDKPKEGTLRFGVTRDKPLWIIFTKDMVITLKHELVILTEGGVISDSETHSRARAKNDGDGIYIYGSSKIWIDHVTLNDGPDGLVDVTNGATCVTISNCKFTSHNKVMLLGADITHTQDKNMQVTVAYNLFGEGCIQRLPRCRYGFFQVVNNDYNKWQMYAIGGSSDPTILSQGNRFLAPDVAKSKQVTQRHDAPEEEWKNWKWKSQNDTLLNGAFFVPSGGEWEPTPEQSAGLIPPCPEPVEALTCDAGKLTCTPGQPC